MKMIRVFGTGIALGYLIGSGKARQLIDALRSSGASQRLAPSRWRPVTPPNAGPTVTATPDVAIFQPVSQPTAQPGAHGAGAVAREAARGA